MRKGLCVLLLMAGLLASNLAWAHETVEVPVIGAWARAGSGVSAVYLTIENEGDHVVRVLGAQSDAAMMTEIHQTSMVNDMMQMRPIEAPIEIPAGESLALEPGGYHIMLMELAQDLEVGAAISVTLNMEHELDGQVEAFDLVIGAPVLMEPPAASEFVVVGAWARPTVADPGADGAMGGDRPMGDATAEPEGDMHMGDATPEPEGGMHSSVNGVSAIYLTLENRSANDDTLMEVRTEVAGIVEIHEVRTENDMMQMRPLEDGLPVAAGESAVLEPGGYHIMLMDLRQEMVPGTAFVATLVFASGAELTIGVPVHDAQAAAHDE